MWWIFSKLFFYLLFKFLLYLNADWVPWRVLSASHVLTHLISIHMLISGGKDGRLFITHQPVWILAISFQTPCPEAGVLPWSPGLLPLGVGSQEWVQPGRTVPKCCSPPQAPPPSSPSLRSSVLGPRLQDPLFKQLRLTSTGEFSLPWWLKW